MSLKDAIKADAVRVFLRPTEYAESVVYVPNNRFGVAPRAPRAIQAQVIRNALTTLGEDDGQTVVNQFLVHVANSAIDGISGAELDAGADRIEFPARDGKPSERFTIVTLVDHDPGMLVLQCH
jgi:hypothetical protein